MIKITNNDNLLKWSALFRWSFGPNSAWGSIERTIIGKTHPTLLVQIFVVRLHPVCRWIIPWWTKARDFNTVGFVFVNSSFWIGSYIIMQ